MNIFPIGRTAALEHAVRFLEEQGCTVADSPAGAQYILLPVPSFEPDGSIKGGGTLEDVPRDAVIIGGNLALPEGYQAVDLLKDPVYLAKNADITAHCAIKVAMEHMQETFRGFPVLIIGWGRISQCLARLLRGLDANVTIAARKETDLALASALGFCTVPIIEIDVSNYSVIYNTAPAMVLPEGGKGLLIDLASRPGIGGENVIWARGLPNKEAPKSSGRLIAQCVLGLGKEY